MLRREMISSTLHVTSHRRHIHVQVVICVCRILAGFQAQKLSMPWLSGADGAGQGIDLRMFGGPAFAGGVAGSRMRVVVTADLLDLAKLRAQGADLFQ